MDVFEGMFYATKNREDRHYSQRGRRMHDMDNRQIPNERFILCSSWLCICPLEAF
jgi:hypothetical protein